MKKIKKFIIPLMSLCIVSCNNDNVESSKFDIKDITIKEGDKFEIDLEKKYKYDKIEYTYNKEELLIEDNFILGLKGNVVSEVKAKTIDGEEDTFKVKILGNHFAKNTYDNSGNDEGFTFNHQELIKTSDKYGENYLVYKGDLACGESYFISGIITLEHVFPNGYGELILKESKDNVFKYIFRKNNDSSFTIYMNYFNGKNNYEPIKTLDNNSFNFSIAFDLSTIYLYINNTFSHSYETSITKSHFGIGGENSDVKISNLKFTTNEDIINENLAKLEYPFGNHFKLAADNYNGIFTKIGEGAYQKRSFHYLHTFFYHKGKPVAGLDYELSFKLKMDMALNNRAQAAVLVTYNQHNMVRFVFESQSSNKYHIFRDEKINGGFTNYTECGSFPSSIDIKLTFKDGVINFYVSNRLISTINYKIGETHLGIGGDNCQFSVSNIDGIINY